MTGVSFLIDTDWVIDHLNGLGPATQRLQELEPQGRAISIITVADRKMVQLELILLGRPRLARFGFTAMRSWGMLRAPKKVREGKNYAHA